MENLDKSGLKYFWDKVKGYISARDARTVQPVGSSMVWYGPEDTIPNDYMREDGRSLKVSEYPELFAVIGYTYGGEGDYFNLPDSRGRTVVHLEDSDEFGTLGAKVGWKVHTLTTAQLPSHGHSFTGTAHSHSFTGASHTHSYSRSATATGSTAITVAQMPSHTHTQNAHKHHGLAYADSSASADTCVVSTTYGSTGCIELGWSRSSTGCPYDNVSTKAATATNNNTGGGQGHTHSISLSSVNTGGTTQGGTVGNATQGGTVGNTGSGDAFNIIQPSIVGIRIIRVKSDAYTKDIRNLDVAIDEAQTKIASLESSVATLQDAVTSLQASTKRKIANAYVEQVDMSAAAWKRPKIPVGSGNFKTTDDTVFSCSADRINIKQDGWYRVDIHYHTSIGTGEADSYIEYGGGYEIVPCYSPSTSASIVRYMYAGAISFDINTASTSWRLYHASITVEKIA